MMDAANIGDYFGIYGLCKTGSYPIMPTLVLPDFDKVEQTRCI